MVVVKDIQCSSLIMKYWRGTWVVQSVEDLIPGFGSGGDPRVLRLSLLWSPPLSPTWSPALGSTLSRESA